MIRSTIRLLMFLLPFGGYAQMDSLPARVFNWVQPAGTSASGLHSAPLFEGSTFDMEWMKATANSLDGPHREVHLSIPANEESILFVKKGEIRVVLKGKPHPLAAGSVVVLMPGEHCMVQNHSDSPIEFIMLSYRSKAPADPERGKKAGGSFICDWSQIEFKPHDKGGIRNYFQRATVMGKRLEMHVTTLNAGLKSHEPHTHRAAEIVLMMDGQTEMQIGNQVYQGKAGSLYYLASNVPHAIKNTGNEPSIYFAFQFE